MTCGRNFTLDSSTCSRPCHTIAACYSEPIAGAYLLLYHSPTFLHAVLAMYLLHCRARDASTVPKIAMIHTTTFLAREEPRCSPRCQLPPLLQPRISIASPLHPHFQSHGDPPSNVRQEQAQPRLPPTRSCQSGCPSATAMEKIRRV